MSYTPTEWKTGDVITAEKLNNMESGIVSGQNNVEFVKIIDNMTIPSAGINFTTHEVSLGGPLVGGKTLGELVNGKTIIGYTSSFEYGGHTYYPYATGITNFSLDKQIDYMNLTNVGFSAFFGDMVASSGSGGSGTLNIWAICI